jgi:hypothetical protein
MNSRREDSSFYGAIRISARIPRGADAAESARRDARRAVRGFKQRRRAPIDAHTVEQKSVKNPPRRTAALVLAFLSSAGLLAQKGGAGGAELTVSVSVTPICTVAIRHGEWRPEQAIDVHCRNFAVSQPQPVISQLPIRTSEDRPEPALDALAMVVINF